MRWESWHEFVKACEPFWSKISLWGHGRSTSDRPKSGYARPFCTIFVLADPHGHGEQVGYLVSDPPPLSDTAMAVRVQKHNSQGDQLTHPTNPEVAACRVPVFGLRFVVSVFPVYEMNLASGFRIFRALFRYEGHERARNVPVDFYCPWIFGRVAVTRPISSSGYSENPPMRVGPFESPGRALHDSGVVSPQRASTRYAWDHSLLGTRC